jgi:hypothetical protein
MRRKSCLRGLFLICFVLFSGFLFAQGSGTTSYIDQALTELNNLEQNQIALKNLITERETTIAEKEQLLSQMTLQYQNLDQSYLLLKNVNKLNKTILQVVAIIAIGEAVYITGDRILNLW